MKFTCHKSNLASGLAIVSRAVSTRPSNPVLYNILIEASQDELILESTNLEMTIRLRMDAHVDEPGKITLPARTLIDLVSTLPSDNIVISSAEKTVNATIQCGQNKTNIKGVPASEFPMMRLPESVQIPVPGIREMIDQVEFAASLDDARPVLCGINLSITGDCLRMVATDGFRVSVREAHIPDPVAAPVSVIVPARSMAEFARLDKGDSWLSIPDDAHVVFSTGNVTLTALVIEGNFPDIEQIIPKKYATHVTVTHADLTAAARQAEVIARDSNLAILLNMKPEYGICISAELDDGYTESRPCAEVTGAELILALNVGFLREFLGAAKCATVTIQCNKPNTPVMFRPDDASFDHIIMPMHLDH